MIHALSVRQPWAYALFHGKDCENRIWPLPESIRGLLVLIHASSYKRWRWNEVSLGQKAVLIPRLGAVPPVLPHSALIGVGRFTGCLPLEATGLWKEEDQYGFQWVPDVEFKKPIPWKGSLGFFKVPDDAIRDALRSEGVNL